MLLTEDHRAVQDAVRAYVQDHVAPQAAAWDKSHHFPVDELRGLAALGCYGVAVPTEWDGAGLDYLALAVIIEEIAAGDGATSTVISVNNCPVCSILMAWANDAPWKCAAAKRRSSSRTARPWRDWSTNHSPNVRHGYMASAARTISGRD